MDLKEDLNTFEDLLNIFLVYKKARKACLIEDSNIIFMYNHNKEKIKKHKELVLEAIKKFNLIGTQVEAGTLISTPEGMKDYFDSLKVLSGEIAMGRILGFYCTGHNFRNENQDRISGTISVSLKKDERKDENKELTIVEVCEKEKLDIEQFKKFLYEKAEKIRSVLSLEKYEVNIKLENIFSLSTLQKNLKDFSFVKKHISEYKNIFANYWGFPTSKLEDFFVECVSTENKKFLPFWEKFWNIYVMSERMIKLSKKIPPKETEELIEKIDNIFMANLDKEPEKLFSFFNNLTVSTFKKFKES